MPVRRARLAARVVGLAALVAGCAPLGLQRPGTADAPEVLRIVLTDDSIDVSPGVVARGKIGLELVNDGQLEHAFRITGPGIDEQSDDLTPGQRRLVWVKLGPGTYRVLCPDGDHAAHGMSNRLTVNDRPSWFRR